MIKTNLNFLLKRVVAYLLDMVIVLFIGTLVISLPIFKSFNEKYNVVYDEFSSVLNEYVNITNLFNDSFKDKEISNEEYNKLIESEYYEDLFASRYEDNIIDEKEYDLILKEIDKLYLEKADEFDYKLKKASLVNSVVTLGCMFLYFGILQYLFKGQTLGKRLLKLRVVSSKRERCNIFQFIVRCLVVNNVFLNAVNLLCLYLLNKKIYGNVDEIISLLISIVEAFIIFFVMTREDGRGIHDLLVNTMVIREDKEMNEQVNEDNEVKNVKPIKNIKSRKNASKKKVIDGEYTLK